MRNRFALALLLAAPFTASAADPPRYPTPRELGAAVQGYMGGSAMETAEKHGEAILIETPSPQRVTGIYCVPSHDSASTDSDRAVDCKFTVIWKSRVWKNVTTVYYIATLEPEEDDPDRWVISSAKSIPRQSP